MEKFKGTQGSWEFEKDPDYPIHGIWSKEEFPTYIARTCYAGASLENAQLIAAAPELLDALQKALALIKSTFSANEWDASVYYEVTNGKKVINKALGIKE